MGGGRQRATTSCRPRSDRPPPPPSVIPAQAGTQVVSSACTGPRYRDGPPMPLPHRRQRSESVRAAPAARVPACAGMTEGAVGMTGGRWGATRGGAVMTGKGVRRAIGARTICGGGSRLLTPHLTSPLREGGGMNWGRGGGGCACAGSCLRRNDGGGAGMARSGAGAMRGGAVMTGREVRWVIGARTICGGGSRLLTPHLTSPLEGGER